jgi:hypothetical protein
MTTFARGDGDPRGGPWKFGDTEWTTTADDQTLSLHYGQLDDYDIGPTWILLRRDPDGSQSWLAFHRSHGVDPEILAGWLISEHVAVEDAEGLAERFAAKHPKLFLRGGLT